MVEISHASMLSRIGFVAQDVKDFQTEVLSDIQNRAVEINNSEATCILDAKQGLDVSADIASGVLMFAAGAFIEEISVINDEFVNPILNTIDLLTSRFEIEVIEQLGFRNAVTGFEAIISFLLDEVIIFEDLFEFFVSGIYDDFINLETLIGARKSVIFPVLDNTLDEFRFNGNLIRNSLLNCN